MCNYKFCILAAGKGTRNTAIKNLHKALLPLENKAVISRIIERVPKTVEIIIAVGYKKEQIKTYLNNIYKKERKITYVDVDKYEGIGSGAGYSLLQCEKELQCPFIFTAADTIIEVNYTHTSFQNNWIGVSNVNENFSQYYCLVKGEKYLEKFYYGIGTKAYIGIAGIYQYKEFWKSLKDDILIFNEKQVLNGFKTLDKVEFKYFDWHDTGNNVAYKQTKEFFNKDIVASKDNECIFIENNIVTKYFDNETIINKRIKRTEYLNGACPIVTKINENMYSYSWIDGITLSNVYDENILKKLLPFWYEKIGSKQYKEKYDDEFLNNCKLMYQNKTYERCKEFVDSDLDYLDYINGVKVDKIYNILDKINWDYLHKSSIPSKFHGDLQPENIIYSPDTFYFIDWRESFGQDLEIGDFYYDLAKLYHALLINGTDVKNKLYFVDIRDFNGYIFNHSRSNLLLLLEEIHKLCMTYNYSWEKVQLLGILQFLNIAGLYSEFHEGNYKKFLFLYGKYLLTKFLQKNGKEFNKII